MSWHERARVSSFAEPAAVGVDPAGARGRWPGLHGNDLDRGDHRSPARGHESRPLSYAQIEAIAWSVRRSLLPELSPTRAVPGIVIFESLNEVSVESRGGPTIPLNYGIGRLPGNFEAWTCYDATRGEIQIVLDESTHRALRRSNPRALFTLAHEIGHAVLHVDDLVRLSRMDHRITRASSRATPPHEIFRDTEFQANAFAAALLMPALGLVELEKRDPWFSADSVRDIYRVSISAAETRRDIYARRREELLRSVRS
jgi:hypothetical protein